MPRPKLTSTFSADDFLRWYWLKEELTAFCQQQGLSTRGSKQAITERIAKYLASGEKSAPGNPKPAAKGKMPTTFTCATVIGPGWTCSQPLRAFFEREIGPAFHFDATMRDLVHYGQGQTLGAAIAAWQIAQANPKEKEIAPQFEYNRHIREYLKAHPGAGLQKAIAAWNEHKQNPKE